MMDFDAGLEEFRPYLLRQARFQMGLWLRSREDPADLVQKTMAEAWKAKTGFRGRSPKELRTWLEQILRRNILDLARALRRGRRDVNLEKALEGTVSRSSSWLLGGALSLPRTPSYYAVREDKREKLLSALEKLPPQQGQALGLHHILEYSLEETSALMGKTRSSVASLIHRGLRNMAKSLESPL
jgi:RNA polymerase sigma-70 factor (ECF subfamily)